MNDRFKFRYVYRNKIYDVMKLNFFLRELELDMGCYTETYKLNPDNLLQCTGLKDKNGTLIYEGDVIKSEKYGNRCGYVVKWNPRGFWSLYSFYTLSSAYNLLSTDYEVIGNIYENPELLEKQND